MGHVFCAGIKCDKMGRELGRVCVKAQCDGESARCNGNRLVDWKFLVGKIGANLFQYNCNPMLMLVLSI
jgi:hypothetical protein